MAMQDVWDKDFWDGKVEVVVPTQPQDEGLGFLDVEELLEYAQTFLGDYARDVVAEIVTEVMEGGEVTIQSIVDETMLTPENVVAVVSNMFSDDMVYYATNKTITLNYEYLKQYFTKEAHNG